MRFMKGPYYDYFLTTSNRGKPKIILDGYGFNQRKKITGYKYWNCDQRRHMNCFCSATLDGYTRGLMIKGEHNHVRNPKYVDFRPSEMDMLKFEFS